MNLFSSQKLPVILQSEGAECGLASIAMIAAYHGLSLDLPTLRSKHSVSLKGATLAQLMQLATVLKLTSRAVKVPLESLADLKLPAVLHWNMNHFVVLKKVTSSHITVHDPALGERTYTFAEASPFFTGVALEVIPAPGFQPKEEKRRVRIKDLLGRVHGLVPGLFQILVVSIVLEAMALATPFFMQIVMDQVIVSNDRDLMTVVALGFLLLMVAQSIVSWVRTWSVLHLSMSMSLQWMSNVFAHMVALPVTFFERRHLGDIVSRFDSVNKLRQGLTTQVLETILDSMLALAALGVMLVYSPKLAIISVTVTVVYLVSRMLYLPTLRRVSEEQIMHSAKQQSSFLETVRGIRAVQLFGGGPIRTAQWVNLATAALNREIGFQKIATVFKVFNTLLFGLERIVVVWLGALLVLDSSFSVGMLVAFLSFKEQFTSRSASLIDKIVDLRMLRLQAERLADLVLTPAVPLVADTGQVLDPTIEIVNVSFRYSDSDPYILKNLSMLIPAGQCVALTGPSGCGKSTLAKILLGILKPTEGEIRIGGRPLGQIGNQDFARQVAAVMQDDTLFSGSLTDNIALFDPAPDHNRVTEAAQLAAVHDEIMGFPMTYNTLIGDMGTSLSGGQIQRILLARALYRKPRILVMDEATSALDVQREALVNAAIRTQLNLTRVIIAHRPETIKSTERVVVMAAGTISEDISLATSNLAAE